MTWQELAACQRAAAQHLFGTRESSFGRSVCNRAYYAAYALVTAHLPSGMTFGRGWRNPEHANLRKYVNNITCLGEAEREAIRRALNRLRQRRENADYRSGITVDINEARESMRDVAEVFNAFNRRP